MPGLDFEAILLLFFVTICVDYTGTASIKKDLSRFAENNTLELVSDIQQSLRKNNDDYKEITEEEIVPISEINSLPATETTEKKYDIEQYYMKRNTSKNARRQLDVKSGTNTKNMKSVYANPKNAKSDKKQAKSKEKNKKDLKSKSQYLKSNKKETKDENQKPVNTKKLNDTKSQNRRSTDSEGTESRDKNTKTTANQVKTIDENSKANDILEIEETTKTFNNKLKIQDQETTTKDPWFMLTNKETPVSPYLFGKETTSQLPFNMLTVRSPGRRSDGVANHFLQAELKDRGVVVAPLELGLFPDFRLPRNRRQFRADSEDERTEEDKSASSEDYDALEPR